MTTAIIYSAVLVSLAWSFAKDRTKTRQALATSAKSLVNLAPGVLIVAGLVGLVIGLIPGEVISAHIGPGTGFAGTVIAAFAGAVALLPSLIAFPLAASLLRAGASVGTIAAFITTLTMVGFVTTPFEAKQLGLRFTLWRNALSFCFALIIALVMGVIL